MSKIFAQKLSIGLLAFFFLTTLAHSIELPIQTPELDLIYGNDDRFEVNDYRDDIFIEKANSVAVRVANKKLMPATDNPFAFDFLKRKLKQVIPQICPSENFVDQVSLGDCSGFLITPTKLLTAGHCMKSQNECESNKWVFGFKNNSENILKTDVYSCKKILSQKFTYNKMEVSDYALIELDREVTNRKPLKYRKIGFVTSGTPLVVIGHPLGLPQKITDGGVVTQLNSLEKESILQSELLRVNYFTTNLDSYGGNSGSPVFNKNTGLVEGIIIQGANDFVFNENTMCLESRHLSNSPLNAYEKVMRINRIKGL